ncbi:MAG: hypothetical protein PSX80_08495 [bacterium]|nr:hypothetical protein [bacterium]
MKPPTLTIVLIAAFVSAACVGSVQPFYDQKDVYFDRALVGTWVDSEKKESWNIQPHGNKEYLVNQIDEEGEITRFEARLFKIGDRSFIDLVVRTDGDSGTKQVFAAHTFVAIQIDQCTSRMSYLDPSWLKNLLANNPKAIRHTNLAGEIVFTDSTKNLQTFIRKHLASPGAFEQTETLYKKGETQCEQKD